MTSIHPVPVEQINIPNRINCFLLVCVRVCARSLVYLQKMDMNRDGVVTLDEFLDCCRNDDAISRSMAVFDSSF